MVVTPKKPIVTMRLLDKLFVGLLLTVFGGIVLHAPLTVGLETLFPSAELLIKSWKEILLLLATLVMGILLYQKKHWVLLKSPIVLLIAAYAALHILLIPLSYQGATSALAGLLIDLRYALFFVLVYVAVCLYPSLRRPFIFTFFIGAFIVAAFALLQVFVLPVDALKYIGYSDTTIVPYLTVDENPDYIRISSTLRGPNPLGAYAGIVLALVFAFWLKGSKSKVRRPLLPISVVVIGSFVALWASYSRSALVAAFVAIGLVALATVARQLPRKAWIALIVIIMALGGGLIASRDSDFVSNVLLHENATTGAETSSNDGHVDSLNDGVNRMVHQPFGGGVGSTGSASLYGPDPLIIENQYLFIAHEVGWIGLVLFLIIFVKILQRLWKRRADWLALGVFASGIGMALIGLLLPVWVDDTVAIIWWGLAAVAVAAPLKITGTTKGAHVRTIHKTSKRTA